MTEAADRIEELEAERKRWRQDVSEIFDAAREHTRTASASSLDRLEGALRRYDLKWSESIS